MKTTPPTLSPELLDVRQTAQLLNIGRNQVYELAHSGTLPSLRLGKKFLFPRTALMGWIERQIQVNV